MSELLRFRIGMMARCADGVCGRLRRVVVDPVAKAMTHLVIEPVHREGLGRLRPADLADAGDDGIWLRCTMEEFERFDPAEQTQFVPGTSGYATYGPEQVLAWPYYGLGEAAVRGNTLVSTSQTITYDTVPLGEVEVRRGEQVHAADATIGRVQGLVIEPGNHHVTHVLLREGHLWGRKQVAIPIRAVTSVDDDGIRLNLSKHDVAALPPVSVEHPDW